MTGYRYKKVKFERAGRGGALGLVTSTLELRILNDSPYIKAVPLSFNERLQFIGKLHGRNITLVHILFSCLQEYLPQSSRN